MYHILNKMFQSCEPWVKRFLKNVNILNMNTVKMPNIVLIKFMYKSTSRTRNYSFPQEWDVIIIF